MLHFRAARHTKNGSYRREVRHLLFYGAFYVYMLKTTTETIKYFVNRIQKSTQPKSTRRAADFGIHRGLEDVLNPYIFLGVGQNAKEVGLIFSMKCG